jgi:hypothetical protein
VYPGDGAFDGLWESLQGRGGRTVVMVHPTEPVVRVEGVGFVKSRPCTLLSMPSFSCRGEVLVDTSSTLTIWTWGILL